MNTPKLQDSETASVDTTRAITQRDRPRYTVGDIEENLSIALSLARGNSPAIKHGARLDKIAFHVEKALRIINGKEQQMSAK